MADHQPAPTGTGSSATESQSPFGSLLERVESAATTITLPLAPSSQTTPTKPIVATETEDLHAPEWNDESEAVQWFIQLRKVLKSLIYRYGSALQKAKSIFEETNATNYNDYLVLTESLQAVFARWKEFISEPTITVDFLSKSLLHDDFHSVGRRMRTPRRANRSFAIRMNDVRDEVKEVVREIEALRDVVDEAATRLEENKDGYDLAPFPTLAATEDVPDQGEIVNDNDTEEPQQPSEPSAQEEPDDLTSNVLRDYSRIESEGLEPIWTECDGYPGDIPPEINEYLEEGGARTKSFVGSIRTIFWLAKCDDVVKIIDAPGYELKDEIVVIPRSANPAGFLFDKYWDEGKMPAYLYRQYMGYVDEVITVGYAFDSTIPEGLTNNPEARRIQDLYTLCRPRFFGGETVRCVKLGHEKAMEKFEKKARNAFPDGLLDRKELWFRGMSLRSLQQALNFFLPVVTANAADNEFGPGMYFTNDFSMAKDYAGPSGAIMVFHNADFRNLQVWRPNLEEWRHLVATCLQIPLKDLSLPAEYRDADVIVGPLSARQSKAISSRKFPPQGEQTQMACVSYQSCEALGKSLVAIIFIGA
ncbi:hypothetical protein FQN55_007906 [Onygenales sp. PD_40]|nr:hypothetical protein FQN55_007906 [Onygenales sp. PD_40]KAK2783220.1 hypothetical protein FQN53_009306 [Emmonsiellopsis sp. PD_33]KAK2790932.1 hypothetical protein FQN52_005377 [Onygenales sp. PD_12]